jgi:hypothetical protein
MRDHLFSVLPFEMPNAYSILCLNKGQAHSDPELV